MAAECAYRKRQFRCWTQALEEIYFYPIGAKNFGGGTRQLRTIVSAIKCNGRLRILNRRFLQVITQALRGHGNGVFVHPIGSRPHNSTDSSGSKLEVGVERL